MQFFRTVNAVLPRTSVQFCQQCECSFARNMNAVFARNEMLGLAKTLGWLRLQGQLHASIFSNTVEIVSGAHTFKAGQEVSLACCTPPLVSYPASPAPCALPCPAVPCPALLLTPCFPLLFLRCISRPFHPQDEIDTDLPDMTQICYIIAPALYWA